MTEPLSLPSFVDPGRGPHKVLGRFGLSRLAERSILPGFKLSLGVTLYTLGRWLMLGGTAIWDWPNIGAALGQTVVLAIAAGLITTLVAFAVEKL